MFSDFEKIVRLIYRQRKGFKKIASLEHPDEESLACFAEEKLKPQEMELIQKHLLSCDLCSEHLSTQLKIEAHVSQEVPAVLLDKIKKIVSSDVGENLFEIFIKLKEKALEIIQTSGDVLVGQELIPAPVLRGRQINEFKEEVNILKDLREIRVMAKIQNKNTNSFDLTITVKDKWPRGYGLASNGQSHKPQGAGLAHQDLRVTLIKDKVELESYIIGSGSGLFENIPPGDYTVEVTQESRKVAVIDLKVKA
jgi:hypothetical protein